MRGREAIKIDRLRGPFPAFLLIAAFPLTGNTLSSQPGVSQSTSSDKPSNSNQTPAPAHRTKGRFEEPDPLDFNDPNGYVSLFDGASLNGCDGDPTYWRIENGSIVGESTTEHPVGNTYISYRDIQARDST